MNICLFTAEEILQPLSYSDERAQHLIKVLHKKEGDTFTAGIIDGKSGIAKITKIEVDSSEKRKSGFIHFDFEAKEEGKPLTNLSMIIGFPRPIQLKRLLRDIAALGVCEVHLTGTELGEKSYMKSTLVEKGEAYKMLLDGTVQAGGTYVPKIFLHNSLNECINYCIQTTKEESIKIALDNINAGTSLKEQLRQDLENVKIKKNVKALAAIGSERGWTDKERRFLEESGFVRCSMGNRIMRTETAATVAGAIILNELDYLD